MFYIKRTVLKNFATFTGKHLCWNLKALRPATLLKKRLQHRCFPVNIAKFLRTPTLKNICKRLLLSIRLKLSKFKNPGLLDTLL